MVVRKASETGTTVVAAIAASIRSSRGAPHSGDDRAVPQFRDSDRGQKQLVTLKRSYMRFERWPSPPTQRSAEHAGIDNQSHDASAAENASSSSSERSSITKSSIDANEGAAASCSALRSRASLVTPRGVSTRSCAASVTRPRIQRSRDNKNGDCPAVAAAFGPVHEPMLGEATLRCPSRQWPVPGEGFEPSCPVGPAGLSRLRMPIPPPGPADDATPRRGRPVTPRPPPRAEPYARAWRRRPGGRWPPRCPRPCRPRRRQRGAP